MMEEPPEQQPSDVGFRQNLMVGAGLAVIAVEAYFFQHLGFSKADGQPVKAVVESGAHPVLGFAAGMAVWSLDREKFSITDKLAVTAGVVLATILDAGAEISQDAIIQPKETFLSPNMQFESAKDYTAALIGFGIALALNRRKISE